LYSIAWIWLIEMTLIAILIKTILFTGAGFYIKTPSVDVLIARYITCVLMHFLLIEDIK